MAKLNKEIWPFGLHCNSLKGEISQATKDYLINTGKALEEDFGQEPKEEKPKQKK